MNSQIDSLTRNLSDAISEKDRLARWSRVWRIAFISLTTWIVLSLLVYFGFDDWIWRVLDYIPAVWRYVVVFLLSILVIKIMRTQDSLKAKGSASGGRGRWYQRLYNRLERSFRLPNSNEGKARALNHVEHVIIVLIVVLIKDAIG